MKGSSVPDFLWGIINVKSKVSSFCVSPFDLPKKDLEEIRIDICSWCAELQKQMQTSKGG